MFRSGLRTLREDLDVEVVGEAADGAQAATPRTARSISSGPAPLSR